MTQRSMEIIRVLILEDNVDDVELIKRSLRSLNETSDFRVVDNETDFLKELRAFEPDLILSDYNLPSFSGLEALIIVQHESAETPFVFVTGAIGEEIAAETVLNGASGLVLKSNLHKLPEVVKRVMVQQDIWHSKSAMYASRQINARVEANLKTLERVQHFLEKSNDHFKGEERKNANAAIDDLMRISKDLKGN